MIRFFYVNFARSHCQGFASIYLRQDCKYETIFFRICNIMFMKIDVMLLPYNGEYKTLWCSVHR